MKILVARLNLSPNMEAETRDAVTDSIVDQLTKAKEKYNQIKADKREELEEASGMAGAGGGSVEGGGRGSAWINFEGEDNEQKTRVASRN